jgi:hypothetical protein
MYESYVDADRRPPLNVCFSPSPVHLSGLVNRYFRGESWHFHLMFLFGFTLQVSSLLS